MLQPVKLRGVSTEKESAMSSHQRRDARTNSGTLLWPIEVAHDDGVKSGETQESGFHQAAAGSVCIGL